MYIYNYRLYDRHGKRVISLVVLADEEKNWQPSSFGYELGGCRLSARVSRRETLELLNQMTSEAKANAVDDNYWMSAFLT